MRYRDEKAQDATTIDPCPGDYRILTVDELNEILERDDLVVVSIEIPERGAVRPEPRRWTCDPFLGIDRGGRSPYPDLDVPKRPPQD